MNARGFTLLEILMYVALCALLLGGVLPTGYQLLRDAGRNTDAAARQEEATFISRKLYWALAGADGVSSPTPNVLIVTRDEANDDSLTFSDIGTRLTLTRGSGAALPLTDVSFPVTSVVFAVRPAAGEAAGAVTAQFSVADVPFRYEYSLPAVGASSVVCPR